MKIVINIPVTDEELQKEFEEQTEEFRRRGLLPIESNIESQENEETE